MSKVLMLETDGVASQIDETEVSQEDLEALEGNDIQLFRWNDKGYFEQGSADQDENDEGKMRYELSWSRV